MLSNSYQLNIHLSFSAMAAFKLNPHCKTASAPLIMLFCFFTKHGVLEAGSR